MAEYIEKSTVLAIIGKHWRSKMYADDAIQAALDEIGCHVPSADVAPVRHGMWIRDGMTIPLDEDGCPESWCVCSECGDWLTASDEYPVRGRYCPNCGAKMDGGKT